MPRANPQKRPCRICRRWYLPDVRQGDRQNTCGHPNCRRLWHAKQCRRWNEKNRSYFKAIYLTKKLEKIRGPDPSPDSTPTPIGIPQSRLQLHLPRDVIQERIGQHLLVIIEYIIEQFVARQHPANRGERAAKILLSPPRAKIQSEPVFQDASIQ
jgi:hypothetical protein